MKFVKIEWKNIFSYGNRIESLEFDNEGKLWQLTGVSGAGKSSLLVIPKLLLYGKTEGSDGKPVKKEAIANRINKNGWIRGVIRKGNDEYVIERKFAPQGITVFKNGTNLEVAGLKDMQGIIDNEIIDNLPYHIFSNVMILSLNNFKSFVSMSPADKRQIIDKIFSLEIINKIHEMIKKDMKDLGNYINTNSAQIYALENTIRNSTAKLKEMEEKQVEDKTDEINELAGKLEKIATLLNEQNNVYREQYANYTTATQESSQINSLYNTSKYKVSEIKKKITLFEQEKCPTCGASFASSEFEEVKKKLQEALVAEETVMNEYAESIKKINDKANEIRGFLNQIQDNINKLNSKKGSFTSELTSLKNAMNSSSEGSYIQKIIDDTIASKNVIEETITECNEKMVVLTHMEGLYSADGIKQQLMNNYIPSLNEEIRNTLIDLNFPYQLEFDNNFDAHLESLSEPIEVTSLSTGEHKKVDLAVLCSILKMIKRKYPQINLVCLDDTLSSLDMESSSDVILHLKDISRDMNLNIFVVSHTQLEETFFDKRIFVEKNAGFSSLKFLEK